MKQSFKCLILVLLFPFFAFSQVTVSGIVKSAKEPLVGVTVWLKNPATGKNQGVATDIDGKFSLSYYYFDKLSEWFPSQEYAWANRQFSKAAMAKSGKEQTKATELLIMNY